MDDDPYACANQAVCNVRSSGRTRKTFAMANLNGNERPEIKVCAYAQVRSKGTDEEREPDQLRLYAR